MRLSFLEAWQPLKIDPFANVLEFWVCKYLRPNSYTGFECMSDRLLEERKKSNQRVIGLGCRGSFQLS